MASIRALLDTSGFYALLIKQDHGHDAASNWMRQASAQRPLLATTNLVLSETATLFKARGQRRLLPVFFNFLASTHALHIKWVDSQLFDETKDFYLRHNDHDYSFADSASFVVMRRLKITDALTTDKHFREAGFTPLLPII